jgi:plasmid stabilization system protein ParE
MTFSSIVLPPAESDVLQAAQWYEDKDPGVGEKFVEAFQETLLAIQRAPLSFKIVLHKFRQARMNTFPFYVHFDLRDDTVFVFAVTHASRNPRIWKKKLRERKKHTR